MPDYEKTIIYKLVCNDLNVKDIYVGHTINFIDRKNVHKSSVKNENNNGYNCKKAKIIRENGGWDNWSMVEIEKYPCNNKYEARARENYWYEVLNATMNSQVPIKAPKKYYQIKAPNQKLQSYFRTCVLDEMAFEIKLMFCKIAHFNKDTLFLTTTYQQRMEKKKMLMLNNKHIKKYFVETVLEEMANEIKWFYPKITRFNKDTSFLTTTYKERIKLKNKQKYYKQPTIIKHDVI